MDDLGRSVPRLSLRFYSLTPTFVKYDGSTNTKWHRSLSIWLQQVRQRWWAGHFDSIIWIACHFAEDVSTYQEYVAMYQEHVWTHLKKLLQRISNIWQVTVRRGDNVSGRSCNLLTSRKMLQRIRNVLQATWRRCCKKTRNIIQGTWRRCDNVMHGNMSEVSRRRCHNASGRGCKSFEEDATTYQEHLASYCKTRWHMYQEGRAIYLQVRKMLQRIRNVLQATWRRCCNIARTSFKGLEEDVTTSCMEHVGRAAQKMSQCSRNVLQVTRRRCYNVSGTSGKLL